MNSKLKKYCVSISIVVIVIIGQFFGNSLDTAVLFKEDISRWEISKNTDNILSEYYSRISLKVDSIFTCIIWNRSPGAAVGVIKNGEFVHIRGYGVADLRTGKKITPDTKFQLASVSKQFTAMAVMMLEEESKLSYDDKISIYFDNTPRQWKRITIKHLLTHTSGLPDRFYYIGYGEELVNSDILKRLIEHKYLYFFPGRRYKYSNSGYNLLSMIIEKVSGKSYSVFLKERIFDPLGMKNTIVYDKTKPDIKNTAVSYKRTCRWFRPNDFKLYTTGASGIYSTLNDLYKWDQALYTEQLVSKETFREALIPHVRVNLKEYYGYGWRITATEGTKAYFHFGALGGARTAIFRIPDEKFTIIILSNSGITYERSLVRRVAKCYYPELMKKITF